MTKLLGVKNEGVYVVNDDAEELETILRFPGRLMMFFEENKKCDALNWAGVEKISGFRKEKELENTDSSSSTFIKTLENFRKKKFSYAEITLLNNEKFFIFLGDIVYLSTKRKLSYFSDEDALKNTIDSEFLPGDYLEERIKEYYKLSKTKYTMKECIKNYIEKFVELSSNNLVYSLKKPEISIQDDLITISEVYSKIERPEDNKEQYKFFNDGEIVIKESSIIMIKPLTFKYEIFNEDIISALKEYYLDL